MMHFRVCLISLGRLSRVYPPNMAFWKPTHLAMLHLEVIRHVVMGNPKSPCILNTEISSSLDLGLFQETSENASLKYGGFFSGN